MTTNSKQTKTMAKKKKKKVRSTTRRRSSSSGVWGSELISSIRQRITDARKSEFISSTSRHTAKIWNGKLKPEAVKMYRGQIKRFTELKPKTWKILGAGAGAVLVVVLLGGAWLLVGDKFVSEKSPTEPQASPALPALTDVAEFALILCGNYLDKPSIVECKYDGRLNAITLRTVLNISKSGARELCEAVVEQVREVFTNSKNTKALEDISGMTLKIYTSKNQEPSAVCLF